MHNYQKGQDKKKWKCNLFKYLSYVFGQIFNRDFVEWLGYIH